MNTEISNICSFAKKSFAVLFTLINITILLFVSAANKGFIFVFYCVVYVVIPGIIIYYLLELPKVLTKLNYFLKMMLVFYLGMFSLFIQYFILKLAECVSIIRFTVPILTLLAVMYLVKHKRFDLKKIRLSATKIFASGGMFIYTIFSVVLLLVAIYTIMIYPAKEYLTYQDFLWHMGNINILASDSFSDFRVSGVIFSYHYFSDLFLAICSIIFKTNAFDCVVGYPVFFVPFLVCSSVYGFFRQVLDKFGEWAVRTATIILIFFPRVDAVFCNTFNMHWLTNVNAVSLALPCLLLILALIKMYLEGDEERNSKAYFKLLVLIFSLELLLSGLKGPFAVVVAGGIGFYFILSLRYKQKQMKNLLLMAVVAAALAVIYPFLLSKGSGSGLIKLDIENVFSVVPNSPLFNDYYNSIICVTGNKLLAKLILLIPQYVLAVGISGYISIFAFSHFIYQYIKRKEIQNVDLFSYAFLIVSMGGYYLIAHVGYSQMYFLFATLPIIVYIGVKFLAEHFPSRDTKLRDMNIFIICPVFVGIFVVVISIAGNLSEHIYYTRCAITYSSFALEGVSLSEDIYTASKYEIDGLEWIRANTDENAVCATNKHYTSGKTDENAAVWFYDSAYSSRQYYIEGYFYSVNSGYDTSKGEDRVKENDKLFSYKYSNYYKYELAKKLDVNYLVIHKNEEKSCVPGSDLFTICFENEEIVIVQVGNGQTT